MILMTRGTWVHGRDLAADIPGRDDPPAERARCVEYLLREHAHRTPASPQVARRAQAELAATRVRAAVVSRPREELEDKLAEASKAIDHLLRFVPARAPAVPPERLNDIIDDLSSTARRVFPAASDLTVVAVPEGDRDTEACVRITFSVALREGADVTATVEGITAMHRRLVDKVTVDERRAIRLLVEPTFADE